MEATKSEGLADEELVDYEIAELTDYELSWVLLTIILHFHSPAGVSLGRSPRNVMLYEIIELLPHPRINIGGDEAKLLEETDRRISNYVKALLPQQMLLPFFEPEFLDNSILAEILLIHLRDWYQRDAKTHEFPLAFEMRLLHPALMLIGLNEGTYLDPCLWQIDSEKIIKEARERRHRRWYDESNLAYWYRNLQS